MRKIMTAVVTMLMTLAVAVVAQVAPAGAASYPGVAGKLTLWQNDGYQGQQLARADYDNNLHNDACSGCDPGPGGNFGDDASSFVNNTKYWWRLLIDKQSSSAASGTFYCVPPYSHDGDLGNNGYDPLEDEISAVHRQSDTGSEPPIGCGAKAANKIVGRPNR